MLNCWVSVFAKLRQNFADERSVCSVLPLRPCSQGIIGLDTSHSVAFTNALNGPDPAPEFAGCRIVAAVKR